MLHLSKKGIRQLNKIKQHPNKIDQNNHYRFTNRSVKNRKRSGITRDEVVSSPEKEEKIGSFRSLCREMEKKKLREISNYREHEQHSHSAHSSFQDLLLFCPFLCNYLQSSPVFIYNLKYTHT